MRPLSDASAQSPGDDRSHAVTVVIPTLDRSHLLRQTLRAVLDQQGVDLEVVVVNDGSSDSTASYLDGVADRRVRVVRHDRPSGMAEARNAGIRVARTDWVAFCDDDDLWAPTKLATQLATAEASRRTWVYAGVVEVDDQLRVLSGEPPKPPVQVVAELSRWDPVPAGASNVVVHRDALEQVGSFSPDLRHAADWDLWLRLARHGDPACVARPLVAYRQHRSNMTRDSAGMLSEIDVLERRSGGAVDRTAFYRWVAGRCLDTGRWWEAVTWMRHAARSADNPGGELLRDGRMLAAATRREIGRLTRRPQRSAGDPAWCAQAERWLEGCR